MLNELESVLAIQRPVSLISVRLYSALWVEEFSLFNLFDFRIRVSLSLCVDQAILELRDLPTRIKDVAEVIILLLKKNGRRNDSRQRPSW